MWKIPGTHPLAYDLEFGTTPHMACVHGRIPARLERVTNVGARERPESHRRIGRPVGRRADFWNTFAKRLGRDRKTIDV